MKLSHVIAAGLLAISLGAPVLEARCCKNTTASNCACGDACKCCKSCNC